MRWARLAVVFSLFSWPVLQAQDGVRVVLNDGSGLKVPGAWFHDVEMLQGDVLGGVLVGFSENRETMFAYTRLHHNAGKHSPLFDALSQTMLLVALRRRGLLHPSFNTTEQLVEDAQMYRIDDPQGPFDGHLILLDARVDQLGMGIFVLVGPAAGFSTQVPMMKSMMRSYSLDTTRIETAPPAIYFIGAGLALLGNLGFVWLGLTRVSRYRLKSQSEEAAS